MEDTKENLDPDTSFQKEKGNADSIEFICKTCDVVYLSKKEYDQHVLSFFHEFNMNRNRNTSYTRPSRSPWNNQSGGERSRNNSQNANGHHGNRNWHNQQYFRGGNGTNHDNGRNYNSSFSQVDRGPPNYGVSGRQDMWQYNSDVVSLLDLVKQGSLPESSQRWYSDSSGGNGYYSFSEQHNDLTDNRNFHAGYDHSLNQPTNHPNWQTGMQLYPPQGQMCQTNRSEQQHSNYHQSQYPSVAMQHGQSNRMQQFGSKHDPLQSHSPRKEALQSRDTQRNRTDSTSGNEDSECRDSHTKELSMKASSIIDAVLKGEAPKKDVPSSSSQSSKSEKNTEDILQKAEKLCKKFRKERQHVKKKQQMMASNDSGNNSTRQNANRSSSANKTKTKVPNVPGPKLNQSKVSHAKSPRLRSDSSGSSKGPTSLKKKSRDVSPSVASVSAAQPRTEAGSAISQCSTTSASSLSKISGKNLKDTVVRMLKYPKSRRGVGTVEKFLQKQKDPNSSKHRLLKLMQPLSRPESKHLEFCNLAPDVQQHILSLIDEVAVEIGSEEIALSDDERPDSDSGLAAGVSTPVHNQNASERHRESSSKQNMPNMTGKFGALDQDDPDLSCLLSSGYLQAELLEGNTESAIGQESSQDAMEYSGMGKLHRKDPVGKGQPIKSKHLDRTAAQNKALAASIIEEAKKDHPSKESILELIKSMSSTVGTYGVVSNIQEKTHDSQVSVPVDTVPVATPVSTLGQRPIHIEVPVECDSGSQKQVNGELPGGQNILPVNIASSGVSDNSREVTNHPQSPSALMHQQPPGDCVSGSKSPDTDNTPSTLLPSPAFHVVNNPSMVIPANSIIKIEPQDPDSFTDFALETATTSTDLAPEAAPMSTEFVPEPLHTQPELPDSIVEAPPTSCDLVSMALPSSADLKEAPPTSADSLPKTLPTSTVLIPEAPPTSADLNEVPPTSADLSDALPTSTDLKEAPPTSADLKEAPPTSADLKEAPPTSTDLKEAPPTSADHNEAPPSLTCSLPEVQPSLGDSVPEVPPTSTNNKPQQMSVEKDVHSTVEPVELNDFENSTPVPTTPADQNKCGGKRTRSASNDDVNVADTSSDRAKKPKQPRVTTDNDDLTMDALYNISLKEEAVHTRMVETDQAIYELTDLLERTKARLQTQEDYKKQLQVEEAVLRRRRIELLTDARMKRGSHPSVSVIQPEKPEERTSSPRTNSTTVSTTVVEPAPDPAPTPPHASISTCSEAEHDAGATLKMEPDTTQCIETTPMLIQETADVGKEDAHEGESQHAKQGMSEAVIGPSRSSQSENNKGHLTSQAQDKEIGNVNVKYLGSFVNGDEASDIIQQLASNFKHLKSTYSFLNNDGEEVEMFSCSRSDSEEGSTANSKSQPKHKVKTKKKLAKSPKASADDEKDLTQGEFKVPKVPSNHKGKRAKKSCKRQQASRSVSESDSDIALCHKQGRKRKKNKQKDKGTSEVLKEYLHCSSSSDVEILGLEAPTLSSLNSSRISKNNSDSATSLKPHNKGEKHYVESGVVFQRKVKPVTVMALNDQSIFVGGVQGSVAWYKRHSTTGELNLHSNINQTDGPIRFICTTHDPASETKKAFIASANMRIVQLTLNPRVTKNKVPWETVFKCPAPVSCGCSAWDKMFLGLTSGSVMVFDTQKGVIETSFKIGDRAITQMAPGQEGGRKLLCMCEAGDPSIYVRDSKSRLFIRSLEGHIKMPLSVKVKNHLVYSGGEDKMVQIHNLNTGDMGTLLKFQSVVTDIVIDSFLLVGEQRGVVNVLDPKTLVRDRVLYTHQHHPVTAMCLDSAHSLVYVGDEAGHMKVMSLRHPAVRCEYNGCRGLFSFGFGEDLMEHIMKDHIQGQSKSDTFDCLWPDCSCIMRRRDSQNHILVHVKELFQKV